MFSGKRILLGVTGGIAAYKAAFLLREFQKAGAEVRVTLTPAATRFVGIDTFAALSGHEVAVDIFPDDADSDSWTRHINWGEWADLFVIAPCTANTLAKIANGHSDNMLCSTVLAARCPVLICPTMDGEMYSAKSVQNNLQKLQEMGFHLLEPEEGYLASGLEGTGRLPEFKRILEKASEIVGSLSGALSGKKVVVTAGPTREFIDPVRFISNPSSGKMGFAMAKAARDMGAEVTLIHGPVSLNVPNGCVAVEIVSASDLFAAVKNYADADIIIMAAAVSDFTPVDKSASKVKKEQASKEVKLKQTDDILLWLGKNKKEGQVLIGFAMETEELEKHMQRKLNTKNADWMIGNLLSEKGSGFGFDTNTVLLMNKNETKKFSGKKDEIAVEVLNYLFRNLPA